MNSSLILKNFIWRFAERCGAQMVALVVSIILARLLEPSAYGIIALITVFTTLLNVFVDSGLGNSLIQKADADDIDFSTVFFTNIFFCIVVYAGLFALAPKIAHFYKNPEMTLMIRVLGLSLLISSVKNVQQAYVSRKMIFKKFFFATLGGTIGAGILGITMAFMGFGVWALIAQNLFNNMVDTIILWITVRWRPHAVFSWERLKKLYSYGWKLLVSNIIIRLYTNLRTLIIGKLYSSADLAYYNKGEGWPGMLVTNINSSIDSVLFPAMSKVQDNVLLVKSMTRRAIKTSVYLIAPMMMGLSAVAVPLTNLLLTEKWLPSVLFMRIFCITYMFYPIHTANLNAIKGMGRSDLFLKLEILKDTLGLIALIMTMHISVTAMGYSLLFTSVASQIINSWPNKRLMNYGYLEQLKDILPGILLAVAMGFCIYPIQWLELPDIVTLVIQVPLGAFLYIVGSIVFKLDSFRYLWGIVKPIMRKVLHRA